MNFGTLYLFENAAGAAEHLSHEEFAATQAAEHHQRVLRLRPLAPPALPESA